MSRAALNDLRGSRSDAAAGDHAQLVFRQDPDHPFRHPAISRHAMRAWAALMAAHGEAPVPDYMTAATLAGWTAADELPGPPT